MTNPANDPQGDQSNDLPHLPVGDSATPADQDSLKPADVPVFNCVAYVCKKDGRYVARNGHWDLACEAGNERDALRRLATEFKQRAAAAHQAGEALPFDDPPQPKRDDETERLIPVHL